MSSDNLGTAVIQLAMDINELRTGMSATQNEITKLLGWVKGQEAAKFKVEADTSQVPSAMDRATEAVNKFVNGAKNIGTNLRTVGVTMTAAGAAIIAPLKQGITTAMQFESAFAGVRKTMDESDIEGGFEELEKGLRNMALQIPVSFVELSRIAELAGQMGIKGKDNILAFTETVARMAVSTDLASEQAATSLATIANIFDVSAADFKGFVADIADSIVYLGNKTNSTEPQITNFAERIAGAGKIAGLTGPDIIAIGAAFSSVGVEAEAGGTAVQKVLIRMTQAVADGVNEGNTALNTLAQTAGMTSAQFVKVFKEDASTAFEQFVLGLGKQGDKAFATLGQLDLADQRLIRAFISMAGAGNKLTEAFDLAEQAARDNNALVAESEERFKTFESQLGVFKNFLLEVSNAIGEALIPKLQEMMKEVKPTIEEWTKWISQHEDLVISLGKVAVVLTAVGIPLGALGFAITGLASGFGILFKIVTGGYVVIKTLVTTIWAISEATALFGAMIGVGSAGLVAMVVSVLATTAALIALGAEIYLITKGIYEWWKANKELEKTEERNKNLQDEQLDRMVKRGQITKEQAEQIKKITDAEQKYQAMLKITNQVGKEHHEQLVKQAAEEKKAQEEKARAAVVANQTIVDAVLGRKATEEEVTAAVELANKRQIDSQKAATLLYTTFTETIKGQQLSVAAQTRTINEQYLAQQDMINQKSEALFQIDLERITKKSVTDQQAAEIHALAIKHKLDIETAYGVYKAKLTDEEIQRLRDSEIVFQEATGARLTLLENITIAEAEQLNNRSANLQKYHEQAKMIFDADDTALRARIATLGGLQMTEEQVEVAIMVARQNGLTVEQAVYAAKEQLTYAEINLLWQGVSEKELQSQRLKEIRADDLADETSNFDLSKTNYAKYNADVSALIEQLRQKRAEVLEQMKNMDNLDAESRRELSQKYLQYGREINQAENERQSVSSQLLTLKTNDMAKEAGLEQALTNTITAEKQKQIDTLSGAIEAGKTFVQEVVSQNSQAAESWQKFSPEVKKQVEAMAGFQLQLGVKHEEIAKSVIEGVNKISGAWGDAPGKIEGSIDEIRQLMEETDPQKRHSPSVVDRVQEGVEMMIRAWQILPNGVIAPINSASGAMNYFTGSAWNMVNSTTQAIQYLVQWWYWYDQNVWAVAQDVRAAMAYMDPNQRFSPSIVDRVTKGMGDIVQVYKKGTDDINTLMEKMGSQNAKTVEQSFKAAVPSLQDAAAKLTPKISVGIQSGGETRDKISAETFASSIAAAGIQIAPDSLSVLSSYFEQNHDDFRDLIAVISAMVRSIETKATGGGEVTPAIPAITEEPGQPKPGGTDGPNIFPGLPTGKSIYGTGVQDVIPYPQPQPKRVPVKTSFGDVRDFLNGLKPLNEIPIAYSGAGALGGQTLSGGGTSSASGSTVNPEKDQRVIDLRKQIADAKKKIEANLFQGYIANDQVREPTDAMRDINTRNIQGDMDALIKKFQTAGKLNADGTLNNQKLTSSDKEELRKLSEEAYLKITGLSAADARKNADALKGEVLFENYSTQIDRQKDTVAALTKQLEELIKAIKDQANAGGGTGGGDGPTDRPGTGGGSDPYIPPPGGGLDGPTLPPLTGGPTTGPGGGPIGVGCVDLCSPVFPGGGQGDFNFNYQPVVDSIRTDDDIKKLGIEGVSAANRFANRCTQ